MKFFSDFLSPWVAAVLLGSALPSLALEAVTGKAILTIAGKVGDKNTTSGADFDLPMLEKLPQKSFTTNTPWDKNPIKFTGPLLRDVLAAAKASGSQIKAVAINDYATTIPMSDTQQFDVILANPPYSIKQWNREAFAADPWGRNRTRTLGAPLFAG